MTRTAFPNRDAIPTVIHRPPYGQGWGREAEVYLAHPTVTPDDVARLLHTGKLLVWREEPAGVIWVRASVSWEEVEAELARSPGRAP